MRITINTGPCFPVPPQRGGGMIRVWLALSEVFAEIGHEVEIWSRAYADTKKEEFLHGVKIVRYKGFDHSSTLSNLWKDFFYARDICHKLPPADILVTNDFWLPFWAPRLAPSAGRVVVSVNRFPKHHLWLHSRVARLIAPTNALVEAIVQQSPKLSSKVECIANPFDGRDYYPMPEKEAAPASLLFVGRVHPEKGVHVLIKAFRILRNNHRKTSLTIVGPVATTEGGGGERYLNLLKTLASGLNVSFLPAEYQTSRLREIYNDHQIFCYPSLADWGEAMGIAPIEAMACGCVPVVSANPVFSDWLKTGQNGFAFNHRGSDPEKDLAEKLGALFEASSRSNAMREQAINTSSRFELRQLAPLFLSAFERARYEPQ